jgi:hypothetical protein
VFLKNNDRRTKRLKYEAGLSPTPSTLGANNRSMKLQDRKNPICNQRASCALKKQHGTMTLGNALFLCDFERKKRGSDHDDNKNTIHTHINKLTVGVPKNHAHCAGESLQLLFVAKTKPI